MRDVVLFSFKNVNKHSNTMSVFMVWEFSCNIETGDSEVLGENE